MTISRIALSVTAIAAAVTLALMPTAASGHTDNLFTWAESGEEFTGFATTSRTDATLTPLGEDVDLEFVSGMEICDEVGYAVGPQIEEPPFVVTWNHDTGALLTEPVSLWIEEGDVGEVAELDTLADCTLLAIAFFEAGATTAALVVIDPATGELTVVVDLSGLALRPSGIATDAAGVTYLFASDYGSDATVAVVDLDAGTLGPFAELAGMVAYYEGGGPTYGVDFDGSGVMWMIIGADAQELYRLTSFAAEADLATATPVDSGYYPFEDELVANPPFALTAEGSSVTPPPAPAPQLAATGTELPAGVVLAAGILLLAGAALVLTRRRSAQ